MTWLRLNFGAVLIAAAIAGSATAQPTSNKQRAEQLNDAGKQAMASSNFAQASENFHQAIVLSPEGRFYFNLCVSLYQEGKLSESLAACKAVEAAGADDQLRGKTSKMITKVKDDIRKLGYDPDAPVQNPDNGNPDHGNPDNGNPDHGNPDHGNPDHGNPDNGNPDHGNPDHGNPNNGNPNNGNPNSGHPPPGPAIVAPPPGSVITAGAPTHQYTWTLGFEVQGGKASFGSDDVYTAGVYGFRFLGDYLIAARKRVGAQATIGVLHTDKNDNSGRLGIDVVDIGIGAYKHFCSGRACVTPLVGVSLGLMQPDVIDTSDALLAVGFRAEARFGFALGTRYEHLLSISAGFQGYTRAFDSSTYTAEDLNLDSGSTAGVVALGYTYRFNTPFGSSPFVTLE